MSRARYVTGIDPGTTNCVVAFAEIGNDEPAAPRVLEIPQLTAPGTVEARAVLPSFHRWKLELNVRSASTAPGHGARVNNTAEK